MERVNECRVVKEVCRAKVEDSIGRGDQIAYVLKKSVMRSEKNSRVCMKILLNVIEEVCQAHANW